jgi:hypothetical protein
MYTVYIHTHTNTSLPHDNVLPIPCKGIAFDSFTLHYIIYIYIYNAFLYMALYLFYLASAPPRPRRRRPSATRSEARSRPPPAGGILHLDCGLFYGENAISRGLCMSFRSHFTRKTSPENIALSRPACAACATNTLYCCMPSLMV